MKLDGFTFTDARGRTWRIVCDDPTCRSIGYFCVGLWALPVVDAVNQLLHLAATGFVDAKDDACGIIAAATADERLEQDVSDGDFLDALPPGPHLDAAIEALRLALIERWPPEKTAQWYGQQFDSCN